MRYKLTHTQLGTIAIYNTPEDAAAALRAGRKDNPDLPATGWSIIPCR